MRREIEWLWCGDVRRRAIYYCRSKICLRDDDVQKAIAHTLPLRVYYVIFSRPPPSPATAAASVYVRSVRDGDIRISIRTLISASHVRFVSSTICRSLVFFGRHNVIILTLSPRHFFSVVDATKGPVFYYYKLLHQTLRRKLFDWYERFVKIIIYSIATIT